MLLAEQCLQWMSTQACYKKSKILHIKRDPCIVFFVNDFFSAYKWMLTMSALAVSWTIYNFFRVSSTIKFHRKSSLPPCSFAINSKRSLANSLISHFREILDDEKMILFYVLLVLHIPRIFLLTQTSTGVNLTFFSLVFFLFFFVWSTTSYQELKRYFLEKFHSTRE